MINTLEKSARTVDAAIEEALKELHMSRDDVSVEILDMGKTGFFGIGASPARVRHSVQEVRRPREEARPREGREACRSQGGKACRSQGGEACPRKG